MSWPSKGHMTKPFPSFRSPIHISPKTFLNAGRGGGRQSTVNHLMTHTLACVVSHVVDVSLAILWFLRWARATLRVPTARRQCFGPGERPGQAWPGDVGMLSCLFVPTEGFFSHAAFLEQFRSENTQLFNNLLRLLIFIHVFRTPTETKGSWEKWWFCPNFLPPTHTRWNLNLSESVSKWRQPLGSSISSERIPVSPNECLPWTCDP